MAAGLRTTRIIVGDCRQAMQSMGDASVDCIVTSPPYFGLRSYTGSDDEIGQEQTVQEYVAAVTDVFRHCRRILKPDGTLWLNIGDSYTASSTSYHGRGRATPNRNHPEAARAPGWENPQRRMSPLGPKQLQGVPWRLALSLQDDGWILRADVIWHKPNCMPENVADRPTLDYEHIFMLAKSTRYYADMASVSDKDTDGQSRNLRSVWTLTPTPFRAEALGITDADHYAVMSERVAERCIKIGCRKGGIIFDPFGGAGTTGLIANSLQRDAVLCEVNPASARIAKVRIEAAAPLLHRVEIAVCPPVAEAFVRANLAPR